MHSYTLLFIALYPHSSMSKEPKPSLTLTQGSPLTNRKSPARDAHIHPIMQPTHVNAPKQENTGRTLNNVLPCNPLITSYTTCTACLKTICTTLNSIERQCRKFSEGPTLYEMSEDDEQKKSAVENLV